MISKKDIVVFAKQLTRRSRTLRRRRLLHPARDWYIGISISFLIGVLGSAYAGGVFFAELRGADNGTTKAIDPTPYDKENIEHVLETFRARVDTFDTLRGSTDFLPPQTPPESVVDEAGHPSLTE